MGNKELKGYYSERRHPEEGKGCAGERAVDIEGSSPFLGERRAVWGTMQKPTLSWIDRRSLIDDPLQSPVSSLYIVLLWFPPPPIPVLSVPGCFLHQTQVLPALASKKL